MFKVVLIVVALNMASPQEQSHLIHQSFNTMQECKAAVAALPDNTSDNYRLMKFCIPENDLLEVKNVS